MAGRQTLNDLAYNQSPLVRELLLSLIAYADRESPALPRDGAYLSFIETTARNDLAAVHEPDYNPEQINALRTVIRLTIETRAPLVTTGPAPYQAELIGGDNESVNDAETIATENTTDTILEGEAREGMIDAVTIFQYTRQMINDLGPERRNALTARVVVPPAAADTTAPLPPSAVPGVNAWIAFANNPTEAEMLNDYAEIHDESTTFHTLEGSDHRGLDDDSVQNTPTVENTPIQDNIGGASTTTSAAVPNVINPDLVLAGSQLSEPVQEGDLLSDLEVMANRVDTVTEQGINTQGDTNISDAGEDLGIPGDTTDTVNTSAGAVGPADADTKARE